MATQPITKIDTATVVEKIELAARRTRDKQTPGPGLVAFDDFAEELFKIVRELRNAPSPR